MNLICHCIAFEVGPYWIDCFSDKTKTSIHNQESYLKSVHSNQHVYFKKGLKCKYIMEVTTKGQWVFESILSVTLIQK